MNNFNVIKIKSSSNSETIVTVGDNRYRISFFAPNDWNYTISKQYNLVFDLIGDLIITNINKGQWFKPYKKGGYHYNLSGKIIEINKDTMKIDFQNLVLDCFVPEEFTNKNIIGKYLHGSIALYGYVAHRSN